MKAYAGKHQGATTNIGRIDPTFGSVTELISNINSSYHALSVDMTNRIAYKYISFDANYTWSHALDYNQTYGYLGQRLRTTGSILTPTHGRTTATRF